MASRHDMAQSGKSAEAQGARRGRAAAAGEDALAQGAGAFARAGFTDASLILRWPQIAGPDVARVAQPARLQEGPEGGTLTLHCAPGAAVLLQHETRALIERLNGYLGRGRVARLRLITHQIAALPAPPRHPAAGRREPDDSGAPASLGDALDRLGRRRDSRGKRGPRGPIEPGESLCHKDAKS